MFESMLIFLFYLSTLFTSKINSSLISILFGYFYPLIHWFQIYTFFALILKYPKNQKMRYLTNETTSGLKCKKNDNSIIILYIIYTVETVVINVCLCLIGRIMSGVRSSSGRNSCIWPEVCSHTQYPFEYLSGYPVFGRMFVWIFDIHVVHYK